MFSCFCVLYPSTLKQKESNCFGDIINSVTGGPIRKMKHPFTCLFLFLSIEYRFLIIVNCCSMNVVVQDLGITFCWKH